MSESKALFFSLLMAAALGLMCTDAAVDQLPEPVGPGAVAYGE